MKTVLCWLFPFAHLLFQQAYWPIVHLIKGEYLHSGPHLSKYPWTFYCVFISTFCRSSGQLQIIEAGRFSASRFGHNDIIAVFVLLLMNNWCILVYVPPKAKVIRRWGHNSSKDWRSPELNWVFAVDLTEKRHIRTNASGKHVREMYTPLIPTFIVKLGYTYLWSKTYIVGTC